MTNSLSKSALNLHSLGGSLTLALLLNMGCGSSPESLAQLEPQFSGGCQDGSCLPPPACHPSMIVALNTAQTPPALANFSAARMYTATTITNLTPKIANSIKVRLEQTWVLTRTSGQIVAPDFNDLAEAGYTRPEYNCYLTALSGGGPNTGMNAWHNKQTGASIVTPAVHSYLAGSEVLPTRVAVLDSGIHNSIGANPTVGWSYYPPTGTTPAFLEDFSGHGSAVASLIKDIGGPGVDMVSVRVLDATGRGEQLGLAKGIIWSIENDARILNMSLGYPQEPGFAGRLHAYLSDALAATWSSGARAYAAAGNLCMGPAGDECDAFLPASAPTSVAGDTLGVTSVSGLNADGIPSDQVANSGVDIWAPSEFVCAKTSPQASSSGYFFLSGSSYAVPQVTGGLALMMGARAYQLGKSQLTEAEMDTVRAVLANGSTLPAGSTCSTGRRLDLCDTLAWATSMSPICTAWSSAAAPESDNCPWSGPTPTSLAAYYTSYAAGSPAGYQTGGVLPDDIDQETEAAWCKRLSGSSGRAVCTSCEIEFTSSGGGYPGFTLSLNLPPIVGVYNNWQLKLVSGTSILYVPLPSMPTTPGTATYTGTFEATAPLTSLPDQAWLMAEDGIFSTWNGAPLLIR